DIAIAANACERMRHRDVEIACCLPRPAAQHEQRVGLGFRSESGHDSDVQAHARTVRHRTVLRHLERSATGRYASAAALQAALLQHERCGGGGSCRDRAENPHERCACHADVLAMAATIEMHGNGPHSCVTLPERAIVYGMHLACEAIRLGRKELVRLLVCLRVKDCNRAT